MARFKYLLEVQGQNSPGNDITSISRYLRVRVFTSAGNISGTPEVKLGAGGTWTPMAAFGSGAVQHTFENLTAGSTYAVYFRDNRGERVLANVTVQTYAASCFSASGAVVVPLMVQVNETSVTLSSGSSTFDPVIYPFEYSLTTGCASGYQSSGIFSVPVETVSITTVCRRTSGGCPMVWVSSLNVAQFNPVDGTFTKTNVTANGAANGTIDVTPSGGSGVYTYLWNDGVTTQDRTGLAPGSYTVTITDSDGFTKVLAISITEPDLLTATFSKTNLTAPGSDDGTITVTAAGGSGSYAITWGDSASTAFTRTGLAAATYVALVSDLVTGETVALEITITDPAVEAPDGTFVTVPMMNSLRWVRRVTPNQIDVFQTFDNTLLCEEVHPYFTKTHYFQKVLKTDVLPVQFLSDYESFLVELRDYHTGALVKSFTTELKLQNIGSTETYPILIQNHGGGQSRIYFGSGQIPIPLDAGDVFNITNNADGLNGTYEIVSINADVLVGAQYLVINLNYTPATTTSAADGVFTSNVVDFNVFESIMSFGDIANGKYYGRIVGFVDDDNRDEWVSEPIDLQTEHPDTNLIEYRCFDNAFDMVWTTGITCRVRVESHFQQQFVGGVRTVSRNCDHSLRKTAAKKTFRPRLETFQLPPYLHTKLAVVFDCDVIRVNGVEYQTDSDYEKPKYLTRYQLANSAIELERVGWFDTYNSHDLGNVDGETGFIIVNGGFLKR